MTNIPASLDLPFGTLSLRCDAPGGWSFSLSTLPSEEGVSVVRMALESPAPAAPPSFSVETVMSLAGAAYQWRQNEAATALRPAWAGDASSNLAVNMPLYAFFDGKDTCLLSVAASECGREVAFRGGILEEGCRLSVRFSFFTVPEAPLARYETFLRFDFRPRPLWEAIPEAAAWMGETGGYVPCPVPDAAFDPLYSSWYSFMQDVHAADLEAELAIAAKLGMKTFIVDDGWQYEYGRKGYPYCGDWKLAKSRFPDMAAHVRRVPVILYVDCRPDDGIEMRRLAGMRRCATTRGWRVETLELGGVTPAALKEALAKYKPIGCVAECWEPEWALPPAAFGRVPVVYFSPLDGLGWRHARGVECDEAAVA